MKKIYFQTEETVITKKKGYIEVDESYTQMYNSLSKMIGKLKSINEAQLLFYLCSKSDTGYFYNNNLLYRQYSEFRKKEDCDVLSERSFTTAIKSLADNKIIIRHLKGQYQLNPFYIWKDTISEREIHLNELIENNGESITKHKYLPINAE